MTPKLMVKWLDALYSGKYKQGKLELHQGDKYCCMGVLCEISDLVEWEPIKRNTGIVYIAKTNDSVDTKFLPSELCDSSIKLKRHSLGPLILTNMNDIGLSFSMIADAIISNLNTRHPDYLKGTKYGKA